MPYGSREEYDNRSELAERESVSDRSPITGDAEAIKQPKDFPMNETVDNQNIAPSGSSVIRPSQVLAKEMLRKSPFCRMFGCAEFETVAKQVVEYLSKNGDDWDLSISLTAIGCGDWDIDHGHSDTGDHNFPAEFMVHGKLNERFVKRVTRYSDHQELKDDVIARLITWPCDSVE